MHVDDKGKKFIVNSEENEKKDKAWRGIVAQAEYRMMGLRLILDVLPLLPNQDSEWLTAKVASLILQVDRHPTNNSYPKHHQKKQNKNRKDDRKKHKILKTST